MAGISAVPQTVDVAGYVGDTLTIVVTAPSALVDGLGWSAQIRSANDATEVAATFAITPPTVADGPAYLVLSTAASTALGVFSGVWDVQVAAAGGVDPVITLARGKFTQEMDVTRAP